MYYTNNFPPKPLKSHTSWLMYLCTEKLRIANFLQNVEINVSFFIENSKNFVEYYFQRNHKEEKKNNRVNSSNLSNQYQPMIILCKEFSKRVVLIDQVIAFHFKLICFSFTELLQILDCYFSQFSSLCCSALAF